MLHRKCAAVCNSVASMTYYAAHIDHFLRITNGNTSAMAIAEARAGARHGALRAVAMGLQAAIVTELIGSAAKNFMLVPRPNFYAGCGWSDVAMADSAPAASAPTPALSSRRKA